MTTGDSNNKNNKNDKNSKNTFASGDGETAETARDISKLITRITAERLRQEEENAAFIHSQMHTEDMESWAQREEEFFRLLRQQNAAPTTKTKTQQRGELLYDRVFAKFETRVDRNSKLSFCIYFPEEGLSNIALQEVFQKNYFDDMEMTLSEVRKIMGLAVHDGVLCKSQTHALRVAEELKNIGIFVTIGLEKK